MATARRSTFVVYCAYVTTFAVILTTAGITSAPTALAATLATYDFNSGDHLTDNFTPDPASDGGHFSTSSNNGIGNSGSVVINHIDGGLYTTQEDFLAPEDGDDTLTVSAYFKYEIGESCCDDNGIGMAGLGFVASSSADLHGYGGASEASLGVVLEHQYVVFVNDSGTLTSFSIPELVGGQWYKVVLALQGTGSDDLYDLHLQIWNSNQSGDLYSLRAWRTVTGYELLTDGTEGNVHAYFMADPDGDVSENRAFTLMDNFRVDNDPLAPLWEGSGTEEEPFLITSCADLQAINADMDLANERHFKVGNGDIDCSDTEDWNGGQGFIPIGTGTADGKWGDFNDVFDGNYKTIEGLTIDRPDHEYQALFDYINGDGHVRNVVLKDFTIVGEGYVGALAGGSDGTIEQVGVENVSLTAEYDLGGLVGAMDWPGRISRSYVSGGTMTLTGEDRAGGLVGYMDSGNIEDSYAAVTIISDDGDADLGGLVGYTDEGSIERSFATGNITADSTNNYVGGLIGEMFMEWGDASLHDSFASGGTLLAPGEDNSIGGLVGAFWDGKFGESEDFQNNFYYNAAALECVGYVDDEMTGCESVGSAGFLKNIINQPMASWDIELSSNSDFNTNNGYPVLAWRAHGGDSDLAWYGFFSEVEEGEDETTEPPRGSSSSGGRSGGGGNTGTTTNNNSSLLQQIIAEIRARVQKMVEDGEAISPAVQAFLNSLGGGNSAAPGTVRDLQYGDEGEDVRALQTLLMNQGYAIPPGATSYFLDYTRTALIAYQTANSISPAAGYFGPATRAVMKAAGLAGLWW